jgi:hypothetical protein
MAKKEKCDRCKEEFPPCYLTQIKVPCEKDKLGRTYRYIDVCTPCNKAVIKIKKEARMEKKFGLVSKKKV